MASSADLSYLSNYQHSYFLTLFVILPLSFLTFSLANFDIVLDMDKVTSGSKFFDKVSNILYVECDNETFLYFVVSVIFFPFTQYRIII
jgi:hypothetical protein